MRTLITLAWRNIWRNKRRTFITMASILFAVFFASVMQSLQSGVWSNTIDNVVNYYFGYVQIHESGYWEEQSINKAFEFQEEYRQWPDEIPGIRAVVPRIESFALASHETQTLGALVVGTDPQEEDKLSQLSSKVIPGGQYLKPNDKGVLVAKGLAENLGLGTGDTLVLISQGFRGVNAAGKYPIRGLISFGSPDLNKQMVYLPLAEAQWFYGAEQRVTSIALQLQDKDAIPQVVAALRQRLSKEDFEIMDWTEMLPDLVQARELDAAGNYVIFFILYLIIGFGIFGTILMMSKEREYEFGILTAIGMRRNKLAFSVWLETVFLGLTGAIAGILVSIPIVWYLKEYPIELGEEYGSMLDKYGFEPILPAVLSYEIFLVQALVVFIITSLLALYPILKIRNLKPVEAMRR